MKAGNKLEELLLFRCALLDQLRASRLRELLYAILLSHTPVVRQASNRLCDSSLVLPRPG